MDGLDMVDAAVPPPLRAGDALFLDFDGTLVSLADAPQRVYVAPEVPRCLDALSRRLDGAVAIVSGRTVADLRRRLKPWDGPIVGQHGLEIRHADARLVRRAVAPAEFPGLARFAATHPGVMLEHKGATVALHYRHAPDLAAAAVDAAVAAVNGAAGNWRIVEGKMVVELVPRGIGKGAAILELLREPPFRGRRPVFAGDDRTDEDGFATVTAEGGVAVRVGPGASAASYRLADVAAVLAWLGREEGG
jgi:trehalose 6-phosphate phosphatase